MPIILIVDDHGPLRRLLRGWLSLDFPGCSFLEAGSGEEAVALSQAQVPDLILMDVQLPGMDGVQATRRIKAAAPQTRVVMLTSFDTAAHRKAASAAGASAFVTKQAMAVDLVPTLAALLPGHEERNGFRGSLEECPRSRRGGDCDGLSCPNP